MIHDPIVEEIHKVRKEHAEKFRFDIAAICADYRKRQKQSTLKLISRPPKPLLKQTGT